MGSGHQNHQDSDPLILSLDVDDAPCWKDAGTAAVSCLWSEGQVIEAPAAQRQIFFNGGGGDRSPQWSQPSKKLDVPTFFSATITVTLTLTSMLS